MAHRKRDLLRLARAVIGAADRLGLPDSTLALALRCSEETIQGYRRGGGLVDAQIHRERAEQLLDFLAKAERQAGTAEAAARWLRTADPQSGMTPISRLERGEGIGGLARGYRATEPTLPWMHLEDFLNEPGKPPATDAPAPPPAPDQGWGGWFVGAVVAGAVAVVATVAWAIGEERG